MSVPATQVTRLPARIGVIVRSLRFRAVEIAFRIQRVTADPIFRPFRK